MNKIQELLDAQLSMKSGDFKSMLELTSTAIASNQDDFYARRAYAWALALNHQHQLSADNFLQAGMRLASGKYNFDQLKEIAKVNYKNRTYLSGEIRLARNLDENESLIVEVLEGQLVMLNATTETTKFENYMDWLSGGRYRYINGAQTSKVINKIPNTGSASISSHNNNANNVASENRFLKWILVVFFGLLSLCIISIGGLFIIPHAFIIGMIPGVIATLLYVSLTKK